MSRTHLELDITKQLKVFYFLFLIMITLPLLLHTLILECDLIVQELIQFASFILLYFLEHSFSGSTWYVYRRY